MSGTLYSLCKEICPPSGIDHAATARFTAPGARNLVVARCNVLQVFLILEDDDDNGDPSQSSTSTSTIADLALPALEPLQGNAGSDHPPRAARLELLAQFRLNGSIASLGAVPTPGGSTDLLLVAFHDAKMSLLEYSPAMHKLITVSLHSYEREDLRRESSIDRPPPELRIDPQGRCAALQFYKDKLAILPFRQDSSTSVTVPSLAPTAGSAGAAGASGAGGGFDSDDAPRKPQYQQQQPFLPSFVVSFTDIDPAIRNVIDFVFLYGYFEPALAIMYETRQTWTGRLGIHKDTVSVVVVSLDMNQRKYPVLYRIDGLPYNCTSILPAPTPVGGIVVLSHNAIIHADQMHSPGVACIMNGYFDRETTFKPMPTETAGHPIFGDPLPPYKPKSPSVFVQNRVVTDYSALTISLDGSRAAFLSPDVLLVVLRDGEMLQVDLLGDEGVGRSWKRRKGGVRGFKVTRLGVRTVSPVSILPLGDAFGILGSRSALARAAASGAAGTLPTLHGSFRGLDGSRLRYGYIFVASRTSDAQLIQHIETEEGPRNDRAHMMYKREGGDASNASDTDGVDGIKTEMDQDDEDELDAELYGDSTPRPSKRKVATVLSRTAISDPSNTMIKTEPMDIDEKGQETTHDAIKTEPTSSTTIKTEPSTDLFRFRLCDALVVGSPFRDITIGQPSPYSQHAFSREHPSCDLEIVSASGDGVHGSLVVLSRSLRPQIVSSFDLPDTEDVWALRCSPVRKHRREPGQPDDLDVFHRFLLLSQPNATLILSAGEEFSQLENTDFFQSGPTVAAGTVFEETCIVQVHPDGVGLFDCDGNKIHDMAMTNDDERWIVSASISDPYILLHMNQGDLILMQANASTRQINQVAVFNDEFVATCSLFCDDGHGGWMFPTNAEAMVTHASMVPRHVMRSVAADKRRDGGHGNSGTHATGTGDQTTSEHHKSDGDRRLSVPDSDHGPIVLEEIDDEMAEIYGESDTIIVGSHATNNAVHESAAMDLDVSQPDGDRGGHDDTADVHNGDDAAISSNEPLNELNISRASGEAALPGGTTTPAAPRHWCIICTENGHLLVLSVPDFEELFYIPDFQSLPNLAIDRPDATRDKATTQSSAPEFDEVLVVGLGRNENRRTPYLIARTLSSDLIIYKIFVCPLAAGEDDGTGANTNGATTTYSITSLLSKRISKRLAIRLLRVPHDQATRDLQFYTDTEGDKLNVVQGPPKPPTFIKKQHLRPFEAIGSAARNMYAGVVVTGAHPCWLMLATNTRHFDLRSIKPEDSMTASSIASGCILPASSRTASTNSLRVHPMHVDGPLQSFAPLHNINVPHSFVYINWQGSLRIAQLPEQFNYDFDWPICKVPVGRTVHRIAYHHDLQTYIMATSVFEPFDIPRAQHASAVAAAVIEEKDTLPESERRVTGIRELSDLGGTGSGLYESMVNRCSIQLVSPVTWETVDSVTLNEAEHVMSLETVELSSKETLSGKKSFVAVGTGYMRSEDLACRGRLHVFDIIDVVPDPSNPLSNRKLKLVHAVEDRSPYSALCTLNGYIVAAIGPKIIMYQLEDGELNGIAFMDTNIYAVSLTAVKNLIQICDIHKSVWLVVFQEDPAKLVLLGKDVQSLQCYYGGMLADDGQMAMLVADGDKNLHVISYAPYNVQSLGGQRLIRRGDMHLGHHVSKMIRLRRKPIVRHGTVISTEQYLILAATLDGALYVITPVPEKMYRRLYGLYSRMVSNIEHVAGLNPRGYRQVVHRVRPLALTPVMGPPGPRGILDGDIVCTYLNALPRGQQNALAQAIGSREDRLLDDVIEILAGIDYF